MEYNTEPYIITFKKMTPELKQQILKISSKIWEVDDYLPYYFDKWVEDRKGEFTAIFYDKKLIGCAKLTFLTDTDIWFEGLRKDPECKVNGVAKELIRYYLNKVVSMSRKYKISSIRFSTHIKNIASIKSNEKMGAKLIKSYYYRKLELNPLQFKQYYQKLKITYNKSELNPDTNIIKDDIFRFFKNSNFFKYSFPILPIGWKAYPYSDSILNKYIISHENLICCNNLKKGVLFYNIENMNNNIIIQIPFFLTADLIYAKILMYKLFDNIIKKFNNKIKNIKFEIAVGDDNHLLDILEKLEFQKIEDRKDFLIYEYPLNLVY